MSAYALRHAPRLHRTLLPPPATSRGRSCCVEQRGEEESNHSGGQSNSSGGATSTSHHVSTREDTRGHERTRGDTRGHESRQAIYLVAIQARLDTAVCDQVLDDSQVAADTGEVQRSVIVLHNRPRPRLAPHRCRKHVNSAAAKPRHTLCGDSIHATPATRQFHRGHSKQHTAVLSRRSATHRRPHECSPYLSPYLSHTH